MDDKFPPRGPEVYQHDPLLEVDRETRLFKLFPGQFEDDICGSFLHIQLDDIRNRKSDPFEALSYTWGDAQDTVAIYCVSDHADSAKTRALEVRRNLHLALKYLRFEESPRLLWIDAICINQIDIVEKNSQIRHLSDIFSLASRVLVWLGEDLGYDPFHDMAYWMSEAQSEFRSNVYYPLPRQEEHSPLPIFARPWFRRKWIIQEVVLAAEVVAHCGRYSMDFRYLCYYVDRNRLKGLFRPAQFLYNRTADFQEKLDAFTGLQNTLLILAYREERGHVGPLRAMWNKPKEPGSLRLHRLLVETRNFECTDPRDFLFSLLGMASDVTGPLAQDMLPDYNLDLETVIFRATKWLYAKSGINVLSLVPGVLGHSMLRTRTTPSWVATGILRTINSKREDLSHILNDYWRGNELTDLGGGKDCVALPIDESSRLHVAGKVIDQIRIDRTEEFRMAWSKGPATQPDFDLSSYRVVECRFILDLLKSWEKLAVEDPVQVEAEGEGGPTQSIEGKLPLGFVHTVLCNSVVHTDDSRTPTDFLDFEEEWWTQHKNRLARDNYKLYLKYLQEWPKASHLSWRAQEEMEQYDKRVRTRVICRKFCKTENGHFALVPPTALDGDLICLFKGAQVPYVVRRMPSKDQDQFWIIGEAYVSSLMRKSQRDAINTPYRNIIIN